MQFLLPCYNSPGKLIHQLPLSWALGGYCYFLTCAKIGSLKVFLAICLFTSEPELLFTLLFCYWAQGYSHSKQALVSLPDQSSCVASPILTSSLTLLPYFLISNCPRWKPGEHILLQDTTKIQLVVLGNPPTGYMCHLITFCLSSFWSVGPPCWTDQLVEPNAWPVHKDRHLRQISLLTSISL